MEEPAGKPLPDEETDDRNPERQGPPGDGGDHAAGPSGAPAPGDEEQGPSGPPPEGIPGDSGEVPNPQR